MNLVSPPGSKNVKIVILLGRKIQKMVYQMMSCPHPKAEARRKIHHPQKSVGDIGTQWRLCLYPDKVWPPPPDPSPGQGRGAR